MGPASKIFAFLIHKEPRTLRYDNMWFLYHGNEFELAGLDFYPALPYLQDTESVKARLGEIANPEKQEEANWSVNTRYIKQLPENLGTETG